MSITMVELKEAKISLSQAKKGSLEYNRIPDFDGFRFTRYSLELVGYDPDMEMDISMEIGFSTTKKDPVEGLKEVFSFAKTCMEIDRETKALSGSICNDIRDDLSYIGPDINEVELLSISKFIQIVSPERESIGIDELPIIDDYKYLFYSNCKWAAAIMHNNIDEIAFGESIDEVEKSILKIVSVEAPVISSVIENTVSGVKVQGNAP